MYQSWLPHGIVCNTRTNDVSVDTSLRMLSLHTVSSVFAKEVCQVCVCLPGYNPLLSAQSEKYPQELSDTTCSFPLRIN